MCELVRLRIPLSLSISFSVLRVPSCMDEGATQYCTRTTLTKILGRNYVLPDEFDIRQNLVVFIISQYHWQLRFDLRYVLIYINHLLQPR